MIDTISNQTISDHIERQSKPGDPNEGNARTHLLYFKNQMSPAYKADEKALKTIIRRNLALKNPNDQVKLVIYCKNPTTKSLVPRNNMSNDPSALKKCNVVYLYSCKKGDCALQNNSYIGHATTTLSRRITMHLQQGGIKTHNNTHHHEDRLTRTDITDRHVPRSQKDPRSWITRIQDPGSCGILDPIFSFSDGILKILDPVTALLPWDPRDLGSRT